ncbi:NAD-dependent epimerase/dehydratase family protein [Streptomyces nogalater]|uniref:NAD-dependent epimerase/dehydratase family protein n=1 Tax=Streptomyces nogalater TaxID=38314 RepID=O54256_STRNO|nr:SnogG [Cosmid vector pSnogaori_NGS]CAA12010.1 SnogG [Streptomyces nogalater]
MTAGIPRTVAVVGATGCVGRHVCDAFTRAGHDVVALARRAPAGPGRHPHRFLACDPAGLAPRDLADLFQDARVDTVVNAAGGWLNTEDDNRYHHVRLVERLLAGTALMARTPRLVQIGSVHEYGPVPAGDAVDESREPRPVTVYARTKHAGSQAVLRATRAGDADGVVLRAVNVCGPWVTPASFLGTVTRRLSEAAPGEPVELTLSDARRDFVDGRDLADAVLRAATRPVTGEIFNIGRGEALPIRSLVALLLDVAGLPPGTVKERLQEVASRGGDWTRVDTRRARRLLGWRPRIDLRTSLHDMWREALTGLPPATGSHGDGYRESAL